MLCVLVCSGGCEFVWVDSGQYMATVRVGGQWTVHGNSSCGWTVHGNSLCGWTVHGNSSCGWTVHSTWQQFVWVDSKWQQFVCVDSGQYMATVRVGGQWTVHVFMPLQLHKLYSIT